MIVRVGNQICRWDLTKASQLEMFGGGIMSLPLLPSKKNPRVRRHQNPNKETDNKIRFDKMKLPSPIGILLGDIVSGTKHYDNGRVTDDTFIVLKAKKERLDAIQEMAENREIVFKGIKHKIRMKRPSADSLEINLSDITELESSRPIKSTEKQHRSTEETSKENFIDKIEKKAVGKFDDFKKWYAQQYLNDLFQKDRKLYYDVMKDLRDKYANPDLTVSFTAKDIWYAVNKTSPQIINLGNKTVDVLSPDVLEKMKPGDTAVIADVLKFVHAKYPNRKLEITIGQQSISLAGDNSFRIGLPTELHQDDWFPYDFSIMPKVKEFYKNHSGKLISTAHDIFHEFAHIIDKNITEKQADRFSLKMMTEFFKIKK